MAGDQGLTIKSPEELELFNKDNNNNNIIEVHSYYLD